MARPSETCVILFAGLKLDGMLRTDGVASSPHENRIPLDSPMGKGFGLPEYYLSHGRNVNLSLGKHVIGAERAVSRSLPSAVDHDLGSRTNSNIESVPYCFDGDKINLMGDQYENGLFSSSMSELFSRNRMYSPFILVS